MHASRLRRQADCSGVRQTQEERNPSLSFSRTPLQVSWTIEAHTEQSLLTYMYMYVTVHMYMHLHMCVCLVYLCVVFLRQKCSQPLNNGWFECIVLKSHGQYIDSVNTDGHVVIV